MRKYAYCHIEDEYFFGKNPLKKNIYKMENGEEKVVTMVLNEELSPLPKNIKYVGMAVKWIKIVN